MSPLASDALFSGVPYHSTDITQDIDRLIWVMLLDLQWISGGAQHRKTVTAPVRTTSGVTGTGMAIYIHWEWC